MSALAYDHVCDPISMFQDTFSLSEFILGQQEDDLMQSSSFTMPQASDIKEEEDSEGEYQEQVKLSNSNKKRI